MTNYHVIQHKDSDKWMVKREGASRASGSYKTQRQAEKAAKKFSAKSGGGEVKIHTSKGAIRDTDTVAPAYDPYPPKDKKH